MNECEWCFREFTPCRASQRYCSKKCNQAAHHDKHYVGCQYQPILCAWCSTEFTPYRSTQRWCSRKCCEKGSYRERVGFPEPLPCGWCGVFFDPMVHRRARPGRMRFCSSFCRGKTVTLTTYNVTGERLFKMLAEQGNQCAAGCGTAISLMVKRGHPQAAQVDHDHACCPGSSRSCGRCIRGLMCPPCNQSLGWLEAGPVDSLARCRALADYIVRCKV